MALTLDQMERLCAHQVVKLSRDHPDSESLLDVATVLMGVSALLKLPPGDWTRPRSIEEAQAARAARDAAETSLRWVRAHGRDIDRTSVRDALRSANRDLLRAIWLTRATQHRGTLNEHESRFKITLPIGGS